MEILNLEQGSSAWLALRKTVVTGTDMAMVLREESWPRLKASKASTKNFKTAAMERGNRLEPQALRALQKHTGLRYKPACVIDREERILVSLDGLAFGRVANCEIKCPEKGNRSDLWAKAVQGKIPHPYQVQIQAGLLLSGAPVCHYWVYDADLDQGICLDVYPDQLLHCDLIDATRAYWDWDAQQRGQAEAKTTADLSHDAAFNQLEADYLALLAAKAKIEQQVKALEERVLEQQVPGVDLTDGSCLQIEEVTNKGSIDYKAALKHYAPEANLDSYRKTPSTPVSVRIKLKKQGKEQLKNLEKGHASTQHTHSQRAA